VTTQFQLINIIIIIIIIIILWTGGLKKYECVTHFPPPFLQPSFYKSFPFL